MIDAIHIAASGMHAEQKALDVIANNLANLNTTAYKKGRLTFNEVMQLQQVDQYTHQPIRQGAGVTFNQASVQFDSGDLKPTNRDLDVAIAGDGFLEVELTSGELAYTRNGSLRLDQDGFLISQQGNLLADRIQVPTDAKSLTINEAGEVSAQVGYESIPLGSIQVVKFANPEALDAVGNSIYLANEQSGTPFYLTAGESGAGKIQQGFLESSNVDLTEELMQLTLAQRGYEVKAQIIRAADDIMRITNSLRS
ncbi:flagellar hook-basal body protein [Zooshikella sp. RANM57]|uniref:flagellar hook-basal body protein n=1 Tax=Zooshikella sp. RANM57 TaxID=3425863 RepID=UPI003D6DCA26